MSKTAIRLLIITLVIIALLSVTAIVTTDKTRYKNSFIRIFPPHAADFSKSFKFNKNVSICGSSNDYVYLWSGRDLLSLSFDMLDTCQIPLENSRNYTPTVSESSFYLQNGRNLIVGENSTWCPNTKYENLPIFTALQPISKNTAVLRVTDISKRKNFFARSDSPKAMKDLLVRQVDGILCTDGYLNYSESRNRIIYTYRYRNQFIAMDTNLNVLFIGKTIDTTSVAKISVAETNGKLTMSKPPLIVNKGTYVNGDYLFVYSNLVAANQAPNIADDKSIIDVYNVMDGSYLHSFYVYNVNDDRMRNFVIKKNILFAEFPGQIDRYELASKYLQ